MEYNLEGGKFDYSRLKTDIIKNFEMVGLKDKSDRESARAMLNSAESLKLKISAIKNNRASFENMQKKEGLLSGLLGERERDAEKLDKEFLALLNDGLCVDDEELRFGNLTLPSLLIQSIQMQDYNRIGMLLAAGAPVVINRNSLEKDTLCALAQVGDINSMLIVLSFLNEPLREHWLLGYLNSSVLDNPKNYVMGELIARRSAELGDDKDKLMRKSINSYHEKMKLSNDDELSR